MEERLSKAARRELVSAVRRRYRGADGTDKRKILDEFVAVAGYHRKHALRLLNAPEAEKANTRPGRRVYDEAVKEALVLLWEASDRICGKRLKAALPALIDSLTRHGHLRLDPELDRRLRKVSASTIDRLLAQTRETTGRRRRRKRARSKVSGEIPIRTFADWGDPDPGFCEGDFVAHCGGSMAGSFVHTFVVTDIASGWTECLPLLARNQDLMVEALEAFRDRLPVALVGLDTDNDGAIVNETVQTYCQEQGIHLTRSRPHHKNDQAWVEQKNGAIVRQMVGNARYSGVVACQALSRLYGSARLFVNFFQPSMKLRAKVRVGGRVRKTYFPAATPCDRLLSDQRVPSANKKALRVLRDELDPLKLLKGIRDAQAALASMAIEGFEPPPDHGNLDEFLAALPRLWKRGEPRPTHRSRPKAARTYRTREDPFEGVWTEVVAWLELEPDSTAKVLFERLSDQNPGRFSPGQLRTLQRRVRGWRHQMARRLLLLGGTDPVERGSEAPEPDELSAEDK